MQSDRHRFRPSLEAFERRDAPSVAAPGAALVHAAAATSSGFRRDRFPSEREKITARDYPFLGSDYEVLAPSTRMYNCIAHALGIHNRWINPQTGPARARLAWADRTFGKVGYTRLPTLDASPAPRFQKVALYGYTNRDGSIREVRHAALQRADGTWTSKLGGDALIRHRDHLGVAGPSYGHLIAVYARPA